MKGETTTTNVQKILEEYLIGKYILNIFIDPSYDGYGYLKQPNGMKCTDIRDGIIEGVVIDMPDYETGSIDIWVNTSQHPRAKSKRVRVCISYDDFNLFDLDTLGNDTK